jgi:hypothetical protein
MNLMQALFLGLAMVLFVIAGFFGAYAREHTGAYSTSMVVPTYGPGGAACGFAMAGGMCCIAAAICELAKRRKDQ